MLLAQVPLPTSVQKLNRIEAFKEFRTPYCAKGEIRSLWSSVIVVLEFYTAFILHTALRNYWKVLNPDNWVWVLLKERKFGLGKLNFAWSSSRDLWSLWGVCYRFRKTSIIENAHQESQRISNVVRYWVQRQAQESWTWTYGKWRCVELYCL